jgi:hypothetical protein
MCDLTPCDFFLWPHNKNSIYTTPINDLAELRNRITQKINEFNNNPIVLENVTNAIDEGLGCVYKNRVHIFNTYSKLFIKLLSPIV